MYGARVLNLILAACLILLASCSNPVAIASGLIPEVTPPGFTALRERLSKSVCVSSMP